MQTVRTKALDYRKIWNNERNESPLKTITRSQAAKLAAALLDRDHVVVEGEARDTTEVARIIDTIKAYLISIQNGRPSLA